MKKNLGVNISTLRKKKGLTQQDLADVLYCSKELIAKIEAGERSVSMEQLMPLSTFLDFNFVQYLKNFHKFKTIEHFELVHIMIDLLTASNYEELEDILDHDPKVQELDYGSPKIICSYCRALTLTNIHNNYEGAQKLLLEAIGLKDASDINMFSPSFNNEERYYSCIALLSVVLCMTGKLEESMMLIDNTLSFLEKHFFNDVMRISAIDQYFKHVYIALLNNKADILYKQNKYDDSILICEKLFETMNSFDSYYIIELVMKLKIQILYRQKLITLAQETYDEFIVICKLKNRADYLHSTNLIFNDDFPLIKTKNNVSSC